MNPSSILHPPSSSENAAIYRRVSTDKQDDSLELQERRTLDYARMKGLITGETLVFSDPDTSGGVPIMDRTGGRLLMHRLRAGGVKHLIIAKLDRLGRNVIDGIGILKFCKENDIALHIVDLGGETITTQGHIGRMILTMLLAVAEWEREEIGDRTRKQMKSLFDQNKLTGNIPYGWDCLYQFPDGAKLLKSQSIPAAELAAMESQHGKATKILVDNQAEQGVILYIWRAAQNRCKHHHIALDLNKQGLKTKLGKTWQVGHVSSVLNNRYTARLLKQTTTNAQ